MKILLLIFGGLILYFFIARIVYNLLPDDNYDDFDDIKGIIGTFWLFAMIIYPFVWLTQNLIKIADKFSERLKR